MNIKSLFLKGCMFNIIVLVHVNLGGNPQCPNNIKTCYNCEVVPNCEENEYNNLTEDECLHKLTDNLIIWSVQYVFLSGYCRENNCGDAEIEYREGSVIHRKTCDSSACADYILSQTNFSTVSEEELLFHIEIGLKLRECLLVCLTRSTACTISYESSQEICNVYNTCQDNCIILPASETNTVYTKSCRSTLSDELSTISSTIIKAYSSSTLPSMKTAIPMTPLTLSSTRVAVRSTTSITLLSSSTTIPNNSLITASTTSSSTTSSLVTHSSGISAITSASATSSSSSITKATSPITIAVSSTTSTTPQSLSSTMPITEPSSFITTTTISSSSPSSSTTTTSLSTATTLQLPLSMASVTISTTLSVTITTLSTSTTTITLPTITLPTTSTVTLTSSTTLPPNKTSTSTNKHSTSSTLPKLYIAPCICYFNKTFSNITDQEIVRLLVNDIKVDRKTTSLQQSKLKSANDSRTSSLVIGSVAVIVLCAFGSIVLCIDLLSLKRKLCSKTKGKHNKLSP